MNNKTIAALKIGTLAGVLAGTVGLHAATMQTATVLNRPAGSQEQWELVAFRDSAEAGLLRDAYRILATGDHDYAGHRVKAMRAVEAAAKLLGMDLAGDLHDRTPQPLSDEKLRHAQDLITQVLASAEVKDQKRVARHLNEAVRQINVALKAH